MELSEVVGLIPDMSPSLASGHQDEKTPYKKHLLCFRPRPPSGISPSPGAPTAASVCCYVAAGKAERCHELRQASGVCVHGNGGSSWPDQPQAESSAHLGSESKGKQHYSDVVIYIL